MKLAENRNANARREKKIMEITQAETSKIGVNMILPIIYVTM